ncbi:hypothetical protein QN277_014007 [Acacia crassicarpa]|nr:hypothetical protein QN277_014007 [Acacia crassicarpa]
MVLACCQETRTLPSRLAVGSMPDVPVDLDLRKAFNADVLEGSQVPIGEKVGDEGVLLMKNAKLSGVEVGLEMDWAHEDGKRVFNHGSPIGESDKSLYKVEFPLEAEPSVCADKTQLILSPISAVAQSLRGITLKRHCESDPGLSLIKRQRKLEFETPVVIAEAKFTAHIPQSRQRRSFRSVKTCLRKKESADLRRLESPALLAEIDFPPSWVSGCTSSDEVLPSSSTDEVISSPPSSNAGGWAGPTTGSS